MNEGQFTTIRTIIDCYFQTACCNAIRNLVSRSKHLSEKLVPLGVESLINQVLKTHSGAGVAPNFIIYYTV